MTSRRVYLSIILFLLMLSLITLYVWIVTLSELNERHSLKVWYGSKREVHVKQYFSQNDVMTNHSKEHCNTNEQTSIVYIKIMKCASTSLKCLLQRFACDRNLEVIFPVNNKIYIGWPYPPKRMYILNSTQNNFYHISCDHVIYDRNFFVSVMKPGVKYITSIRRPYGQFKSVVNYFNVLNISGIPLFLNEAERFQHFMFNLEYYDIVYGFPHSSRHRYCVPNYFSMTKNLMSLSLGFDDLGGFKTNIISFSAPPPPPPSIKHHKEPQERSDTIGMYVSREQEERRLLRNRVKRWLANLDNEINLVLIVEWLPESLILMRRIFCWSMRDVLVQNANMGSYDFSYAEESTNAEMESVHRAWSWIDYELYSHFNKSLWDKLNSQPISFWKEVKKFKEIVSKVTEFCSQDRSFVLIIERSEWNDEYEFDSSICFSSEDFTDKLKLKRRETIEREGLPSDRDVKLDKSFC